MNRTLSVSGESICPYCGQSILDKSDDHIFPEFMGGTRKIPCCKPCNDRFGHRFEAKAAEVFQKLHFYLRSKGVTLTVPQVRLRRAFTLGGNTYDASVDNGEVKFTLSRPKVSFHEGILNAEFGSEKQLKPLLQSLRKKQGMEVMPSLTITPALMPKSDVSFGPECQRLAIKMCAAISTFLTSFTSSELYSSNLDPERRVGDVVYDFRTHTALDEVGHPLAHIIYVERNIDGICGVVRFFGANQYYCQIGPPVDKSSGAAWIGMLDPVTGLELFREIAPLCLTPPPKTMTESTYQVCVRAWADQLCRNARACGASDDIEISRTSP